jgi:hypothetical protein
MKHLLPGIILFTFLSGTIRAQNVGISDQIFTPQSPMHVYRTTDGNLLQLSRSTAANSGFQIAVTGTNNYQLINRQYGSMSLFTNNLERMRIIDEGRVQINYFNISPHQLTIGGNNQTLRLLGTLNPQLSGARVDFGITNNTYITEYDLLRLRIHSNYSTIITGNSATGGVGITNMNTTFNPQSILHVYRNTNANFLQLSNSTNASSGLIFSLDFEGWNMRNHEDNALTIMTGNSFLRFMTNDLERMRVTSAGNVGIGTDAPSTLFHVHGGVRFSDLPTPSAQSTFLVIDPSGYVQARYLPPASFTPPEPAWLLEGNAGTDPTINYIGTSDATDFVIRTGAAERIRVRSTGNVGIGTNNPQRPFHLSGIARISTLAEPAGALVRSNADGDLSTIALTGDPNDVLLGDGTWGTVATSAWEISGNNNTIEGTNFIGTTNAQGLDIRTNNFMAFRITQDAFIPPTGGGGRLLAAYFGNANSPIYSFLDDSRMGMYRSGSNQLSFSTNGAERLRLPNCEQIQSVANGDATMPAWSFVQGPNMGMYRIGNNILGFSTNSNERIRIDAIGNVGVGGIPPTQKLDIDGQVRIRGGAPGVGKVLTSDANGVATWETPVAGGALPPGISGQTLRHDGSTWTANSTLFNNGMNVGVGTTTPASKFTSITASGSAVRGESAFTGNGEAGVTGVSTQWGNQEIGVLGDYGLWGTGVFGMGWAGSYTDMGSTLDFGVFGTVSYSTGTGVYARNSSSGANALYGWGNSVVTGSKSASVPTSQGNQLLYSMESPEIWFEDFGSGKLENGKATVLLDQLFLETVHIDDEHPYRVFLQMEGDCKGLFVSNKTETGFEVREIQGGQSDIAFSYRIIAKRKHYQDHRFGCDWMQPFEDNSDKGQYIRPYTISPEETKKWVEEATRKKEQFRRNQ